MRKTLLISFLVGTLSALGMYWAIDGKRVPISVSAELPNGMIFTGRMEDGRFEGKGELKGIGRERYLGNFVSGKLDGDGEYWDEADNHYVGSFVQGSRTGNGTLTFVDGSTYTGEFVAGEFNGRGELRYPNGRHYEGEFERSVFHGEGKFTESDEVWFEGQFEDGEIIEGKSVTPYANYEGGFKNWLFDGEGVYIVDQETEYHGQFVEGALSGKGKIIESDGSVYEGDVSRWMAHGKGKKVLSNGDVYSGMFEYGVFHGRGKLELAEPVNGQNVVQGEWAWGELENDPREPEPIDRAKTEALLFNQERLLSETLDNISSGQLGKIEMYTVGFAGYGKQDVFLKEIYTIGEILDQEPFSPGRSGYLINHYDTSEIHPMATLTTLKKILNGVGGKMNVSEDFLFLYLTSHGSKEHELSVRLEGIRLPGISPSDLASALSDSGIRWKVVVISACYSGGFIPALEDDNTLIITAAKSDRRSFGCSDDSEMTYFGDAFFKLALSEGQSFESAFTRAQEIILKWEDERHPDDPHSEPQISIGKSIAQHLKEWESSQQKVQLP